MTITEAKKLYPNIKEKKVAYNFLFSYGHINNKESEFIINIINKDYSKTLKGLNLELVKKYILNNCEKYKTKPFIATSYDEINEKII